MPETKETIELSMEELRELAGYAAVCAGRVLPIFERHVPDDTRPRAAVEAAFAFSKGGKRSNALRASAFGAYKAAREASLPAAAAAAQAATQAVGAAYLHPLAKAHQVWHILGAAAYAARAAELDAGDDRRIGAEYRDWALRHAPLTVSAVLARYPAAPAAGRRTGELLRELDAALRSDLSIGKEYALRS